MQLAEQTTIGLAANTNHTTTFEDAKYLDVLEFFVEVNAQAGITTSQPPQPTKIKMKENNEKRFSLFREQIKIGSLGKIHFGNGSCSGVSGWWGRWGSLRLAVIATGGSPHPFSREGGTWGRRCRRGRSRCG